MSNPYSFETGRLLMTSGIAEAMKSSITFSKFVSGSIARYVNADWGNTHPDDCKMNRQAIRHRDRIFAAYVNPDEPHETIWIITESDRKHTTVLFPEEYKYLMEISRYFGGTHTFVVTAENKADAMAKGEIELERNPLYRGDVYRRSLRVVKKLQK